MAKLIEIEMRNDDGMFYGIHVIVVAATENAAMDAILAKYGEGVVYGQHSITDQFHWTPVVARDSNGNANRDNDVWVWLLDEFLSKRISFGDLREVIKELV
jgi:hypothetical protein